MMRLFIVVFVVLFVSAPVTTFAQSDVFTVNFHVSGDVTPPSTPQQLTATPIASTQINLAWDASTDDVAVEGYQVFRDMTQIATTSLTTYSDTGLTASTTYSYSVTAFDATFNYSSSSAVVSTTTLQTPAPTPPSDDGGGADMDVALVSFSAEPDISSVRLSWETNRYAQFQLRWGRTTSYELGFVSNEVFKREHTTLISDLEPSTTYEYQLIGFNRDGQRFVLSEGQFNTLTIPDTFPPSNVSNLSAVLLGADGVALSWENPADPDFSHVRIVRSHLFYPVDPYDGFIAYQGKNETFSDAHALQHKAVQYYTVFSYDYKGNVSSGAVVAIGGETLPQEEGADTPLSLSFDDMEAIQKKTPISNGILDGVLPTTLRIPYEKLPEHLKTIVVTLTHPEDPARTFSFLLRVNKDKTFYEAIVAPLIVEGRYPVSITVYDYQTKQLVRVAGEYTVVTPVIQDQAPLVIPLLAAHATTYTYLLLSIVLLALLALILLLLWKYIRTR